MALFGGITLPGRPDLDNVMRLDLLPVAMTMRMQRVGFAVDIPALHELSLQLEARMKELKEEICSYIPEEKLDWFISRSNLGEDQYLPMNVNSRSQLADLLFDTLGIGEGRQLKTTKSGTRVSTGKKQLESIKRLHPVIQPTLDYAELTKLKGTYADALPLLAKLHPRSQCCPVCELSHVESTWRIHTTLLDTRTDTGRYASKDPNLQNIPVRTAWGRKIRACFIAGPGKLLVSSDYSQEEMRIGAHYSQDPTLIEIFEKKLDPHLVTAMKVFKLTPEQIPTKGTKEFDEFKLAYRDPSRHLNFGIFYGLTPPGLTDQVRVTYATAGRELPDFINDDWSAGVINDWFQTYSGVLDYLENQHYRNRRYGIGWTLFGRVRRVPEVRSVHSRIHAAGLRQGGNSPIQGTGADIMRLTIGEVGNDYEKGEIKGLKESGVYVEPLMTIHDDLIQEVDEDYASTVGAVTQEIQRELLRDKETGEYLFRVPLEAEAKIMSRWEK